MAQTKLNFRQLFGKLLIIGGTSANQEGLLRIRKGSAPVSTLVADIDGSVSVTGDFTLGGDLNITGSLNSQNVTDLVVVDKTITLNKGGAANSGTASGINIEAGGSIVGKLVFDSSSPTNFKIGDGTNQSDVVNSSSVQTLTNKTFQSPVFTGVPTTPTASLNTNTTQVASTQFVRQEINAYTPPQTVWLRSLAVSGSLNSSNKVFTVPNTVFANSEQVFLNGQLLNPGANNDYIFSGTTLTFQAAQEAPSSEDVLRFYGVC